MMRSKALILACLISFVVSFERADADTFTFQLDTIPDGVSSFGITESGLTLLMLNPVSSTGFIDADDPGGANRGLTFDFQGSGTDDMSSVDISFDRAITVVGYTISVSTDGFDNGTYTMSFGTETGLSTALNSHTLPNPIDLMSGQLMTIAESSGPDFGLGAYIISSITVEAVPEPSTCLFLAIGGFAFASRRKRN